MHFQKGIQVLWLIPLVVVSIHFGLGFSSLFPTNKRGEWEEFRVYNAYQPFSPLNIFPSIDEKIYIAILKKHFYVTSIIWMIPSLEERLRKL